MKKISKFMMMTTIAVMSFGFASCDDEHWDNYYDRPDDVYNDEYGSQNNDILVEAQSLTGIWYGTMNYTYTDDSDKRVTDEFNVEFNFIPYSSKSVNGRGTEIDSDNNGNSQTLTFKWYVDDRNGNINIQYDISNSAYVMDCSASNKGFILDLNKGLFEGYMEGVNNDDEIYIKLYMVDENSKAVSRSVSKSTVSKTTSSLSFGKGSNFTKPVARSFKLNNRR